MKYVHIVDDVPELEARPDLPLVVALDGFLDAGHAASLAAQHINRAEPAPVVATFDVDAFHDYRARRPAVTFSRDHYTDYAAPRLVVRLARDEVGTPYLLLTGPEPDSRWEAFARAVRAVVERFDVGVVLTLDAVPMTTPHTRALPMTQHANNPERMVRTNVWDSDLRVPASAHAMLSVRLGEWGHDVTGYVVHVPHYLAEFDNPAAARALVQGIQASTDLVFDLADLDQAAQAHDRRVAEHIEGNPEVATLVEGLEQQYDAFRAAEESGRSLLAEGTELPTGEELGAEFERFLAGLDGPDQPREGN
ncbi:PAC2 family protein [Nocardioides daejeonensis]|uniref:PAC2 family protein n=1 Tax=Nocardioides daejeonensis TaxID=1046556 RepID=UPI000D744CF7|nr:PAC2 family protein [Nocardioides daejeonensis]